MRFVKPLDEALVGELAERHDLLVTVEENEVMGGAGSAVCEALARLGNRKTPAAAGPCPTASSTMATRRASSPRWAWTPRASRPQCET